MSAVAGGFSRVAVAGSRRVALSQPPVLSPRGVVVGRHAKGEAGKGAGLALDPGMATGMTVSLAMGHISTQVVRACATLKVTDALHGGPLTASEVAAAIGGDADACFRLLRAAAGFGVVNIDASAGDGPDTLRFANTTIGDMLRANHPQSTRPIVLWETHPYITRTWIDGILPWINSGAPQVGPAGHMPGVTAPGPEIFAAMDQSAEDITTSTAFAAYSHGDAGLVSGEFRRARAPFSIQPDPEWHLPTSLPPFPISENPTPPPSRPGLRRKRPAPRFALRRWLWRGQRIGTHSPCRACRLAPGQVDGMLQL